MINELIEIVFDKNNFIIDDQYCIDPKCDCGEVILSFIRVNSLLNEYHVEFTVSYNFKIIQYEISDMKSNLNYDSLFKNLIKERKDLIDIFKSRYKKMKEQGENYSNNTNKPIRSTKVGSNEQCPCDSGKKYKQCCGK